MLAADVTAALTIPAWLDAASAAVGGLFGALTARQAGLDLMGSVVIAVATGLGGGLLRDTLLQRGTPVALTNPWLISTALVAALGGILFARVATRLSTPFALLDALFLGVYSVVGADKAVRAELPLVSCVLLGVITGVGGGVLRDILVGDRPVLLRPGAVYATAAALGATLYAVPVSLTGNAGVWFGPAVALVVALRLGAIRLGWSTPSPEAVDARVAAVAALPARLARRVPIRRPHRIDPPER
ncbi:trimeric intracellular cation channel family protein [Cryptosporangium aurantiacum]|uniref:Uncharacterized membrane protein YeiH n=1 Tax=Cryptosporangium aurantiacum TaxID=134849 RepID=A0A1M7RG17_9ACTN|nr:TRIC cation channel family protein [Cryptosporangium aurantiacum]SHN45089.1 Uncharacterized membrane protein YeiH [Cryptosporangium aurantiacum]